MANESSLKAKHVHVKYLTLPWNAAEKLPRSHPNSGVTFDRTSRGLGGSFVLLCCLINLVAVAEILKGGYSLNPSVLALGYKAQLLHTICSPCVLRFNSDTSEMVFSSSRSL